MTAIQTTLNLTQTEKKIRDFGKLEQGWYFGEGVPPTPERIKQAIALHGAALGLGYFETDAFPGISGEVRVTIYRGKTYLEFTFESDESVTFVHEEGGEEVEYTSNLTHDQAFSKLLDSQARLWATSASYTPGTMTAGSEDSKALRSKIPQVVASPHSTENVRFRKAEPYVLICAPITQVRQVIPRSFGTSQLVRYLRMLGSTLTPAQAAIHVTET